MSVTVGVFLVWFAFLAGALLAGGRAISSPWLFLLRSFFPNWRFFHALGRAPRLEHRHEIDGVWTQWERMMPRAAFRPSHLLYNPAVNLALTEQNLVDHLAADVASFEGADAAELVTYRMVERLVRERVKASGDDAARMQFRIRLAVPGRPDEDDDVVLLSPGLPA